MRRIVRYACLSIIAVGLCGAAGADDSQLTPLLTRLETDAPDERRETRERLLELGPAITPALLGRIEHPESSVRWKVVNLLGHLRDPRALLPLVDRAVLDVDPHVRWRALWALDALDHDHAVVEALLARLEHAPERWAAAVGLSRFGSPEAIPVLLGGVRSPDAAVRFEALFALRRVHDPDTSTALLVLLDHAEVATRRELAMTLGTIGDGAAVDGLIGCLGDPAAAVRWRAAKGLARAGDPRALPALHALLRKEADGTVIAHTRRAVAALTRGRSQSNEDQGSLDPVSHQGGHHETSN